MVTLWTYSGVELTRWWRECESKKTLKLTPRLANGTKGWPLKLRREDWRGDGSLGEHEELNLGYVAF